jgi:hypothetical protein
MAVSVDFSLLHEYDLETDRLCAISNNFWLFSCFARGWREQRREQGVPTEYEGTTHAWRDWYWSSESDSIRHSSVMSGKVEAYDRRT